MNKPILYSDFDGVIYDTIAVAFKMMKEANIDVDDRLARDKFFRYIIDYVKLYENSTIINDAVNKLMNIKNSNIFSDVIILTKLSGNYDEERIKRNFLQKVLPEIKVVTMQYDLNKATVVLPEGHVLVDDEKRNCRQWNDANGVAILFRKEIVDLQNDIINDLDDLTNTESVKRLIKRY